MTLSLPDPTRGWGYDYLRLTVGNELADILISVMIIGDNYLTVTAIKNPEDLKGELTSEDDSPSSMSIDTFDEGITVTIIVAAVISHFVDWSLVSHAINYTADEGDVMISFVFKK